MSKSVFILGILSGIASIIFFEIYQYIFFVDFTMIVSYGAIFGACLIGTMLMSLGYFALLKMKKMQWMGIVNILYMIVAFLSILPPMRMSLPLEVEFPELFPGLVIPMHFFVPMMFFGLVPFFKIGKNGQLITSQ